MFVGATQTNVTATSRLGTTVTGGVANTKGAYSELIASTNSAVYGLMINVRAVFTAATNTNMLLDIATGAAASEVVKVADLLIGASTQGRAYFVPLSIASGERVSARLQGAIASDTAEVAIRLYQSPLVAYTLPTALTTFGANTTTSSGVSVTPGNGSFGSWTEIGTLAADLDTWFVGYDLLGDTTVVSAGVLVEIGHGPNSGAVTSIGETHYVQFSDESLTGGWPLAAYRKAVLSGDKVWARIASGEAEARGVCIYGGTSSAPASGGGPLVHGGLVS